MVALVTEAGAENFIRNIRAEYYGHIKGADKGAAMDRILDTAIFVTKPGPGASIMEI